MFRDAIAGLILPKVIYTANSDFNGKIEVLEVGKTRKIKVGGIDQSLDITAPNARRLVWGKAVEVLKINEPRLKNILIFGLGGGTVQHFLSQDFPGIYITSVDIDPVMVDIANKYFHVDQIPNHKIIVEDACRVVVEPEVSGITKKSFQAAFVDIYIGENFPDLGSSGNFVSALKTLVIPGGLILFNRIYTKHHQESVNNFTDFLREYLNDVQTYTVAGYTNSDNVIIYGRA